MRCRHSAFVCVSNPPAGPAWALSPLRRACPFRGLLRAFVLLVELQPLPDRLELRRAPRGQPTPIGVRMYARILVGRYDAVVPIEADQVLSQLLRAVASTRNRPPVPPTRRVSRAARQECAGQGPSCIPFAVDPCDVSARPFPSPKCSSPLRCFPAWSSPKSPCVLVPVARCRPTSTPKNSLWNSTAIRAATQGIPSREFAHAANACRARCRSALGFR